jgi:hypothetical protein
MAMYRTERSAAELVIPVLQEMSAELILESERPLRVKAIDRIERDFGQCGRRHPLAPAIHLAAEGSDEPAGLVFLREGVLNYRCTNFHTMRTESLDVGFAKDPKQLVADVVAKAFDTARFAAMVERMSSDAWSVPLDTDSEKFIAMIGYRYELVQQETDSIMRYLQRESATGFGVHSAITRAAQDFGFERRELMEDLARHIRPGMWHMVRDELVDVRMFRDRAQREAARLAYERQVQQTAAPPREDPLELQYLRMEREALMDHGEAVRRYRERQADQQRQAQMIYRPLREWMTYEEV